MSTYCASTDVTDLLPPSSIGSGSDQITSTQLTACITAGSADVDAKLAHLYWTPFTDYSAGPPEVSPPQIVREAAWFFAAYHAYLKLGAVNQVVDTSSADRMRAQAVTLLEPIIAAIEQIPPETTYESLTSTSWGDGDPYDSNTAPLSIVRGEYVAGSGRMLTHGDAVTDYQLGLDFWITYYSPTRKWVVTRGDSAIGAGVGAENEHRLYYEVSRIKRREDVQPGIRNVEVIRG